jgi:hypothetical protein
MVAELPVPVKRYFLHAIKPGTPVASSVSLKMSGSFRMRMILQGFEKKSDTLKESLRDRSKFKTPNF